jgi:hypothetical protein
MLLSRAAVSTLQTGRHLSPQLVILSDEQIRVARLQARAHRSQTLRQQDAWPDLNAPSVVGGKHDVHVKPIEGACAAMLLLCVVPLPRAVSIASNLLVSTPAVQSVLDGLRADGVQHLAAVNYDPGDTPAALVESGALDCILESSSTNEPIASGDFARAAAIEQWIHVCDSVPRLAGARRVGARTVWLNEQAAADENSRGLDGEAGESSGYLARGIIADLADGVCGCLADLPATLRQVRLPGIEYSCTPPLRPRQRPVPPS